MPDTSGWNWDPGRKVVFDAARTAEDARWIEEIAMSPDGEKGACIVCTDDAEFGVCINGEIGESRFEKAILPRFSPDGRFTAQVSADMEWTLAVDGVPWEEGYGFTWNTMFGPQSIAVCAQQDMRYGMVLDGEPWPQFFENANNWTLSPDGTRSAAAVQVRSTAAADIDAFQRGVFSVAVDGEPWDEVFMNCYTPVFSPDGSRVACQVRRTLYDYSIAVDGAGWAKNFPCVWEPVFAPESDAVYAPVRVAGKWGMARDGELVWEPRFTQLWQQRFGSDGRLWAIGAPGYGQFTVIRDKAAWSTVFPVVTDLVVSPDGSRGAAIGRTGSGRYRVMVDDEVWDGEYDMLWPAVFSPDSSRVACVAEKDGAQTVLLDGRPGPESFDRAFAPAFDPAGEKVLLRGVTNNAAARLVARASQF